MNIKKHLNLWDIATRNLWREKGKTIALLTPLIIVMGAASALTFVRDGFFFDAKTSMYLLPDVMVQKLVGGRVERIPTAYVAEIEKLSGISKMAQRVWGYLPLRVADQDVAYTLMGIDVLAMPIPDEIDFTIEEGRFLKDGDENNCVIGVTFAKAFDLDVGDTINLKDSLGNEDKFDIAGLFASSVHIYTADLILTSLATARHFFGYKQNEASDLCVYLDNPVLADSIAQRIAAIDSNLRVLTRDKLADITQQAYGGRSGVFQLMWMILLLTVMILGWSQASNITLEKRKEIGILKAIGWGTLDVIELKMLESLIIGFLGILLGLIIGLGYLLIGAPGIKEYFLGWAAVYPDFPIPIYVSPSSILLLIVVGIFPLLVATVVPSWLTGIIEPDEAIRK